MTPTFSICSALCTMYTTCRNKYLVSCIVYRKVSTLWESYVTVRWRSHPQTSRVRLLCLVLLPASARSSLMWFREKSCPANTIHWPNAGLMLGQRRRRWPVNEPALGQYLSMTSLHTSPWLTPPPPEGVATRTVSTRLMQISAKKTICVCLSFLDVTTS